MKNKELLGYRGYIGSRVYSCGDYPQFVQNLLIRNYCQKHNLTYLLSATEYMMPGCYMMLKEVLDSMSTIQGIVMFSIFMLPDSPEFRRKIYRKILSSNCVLHAALEDLSIHTENDILIVEDILKLSKIAWKDDKFIKEYL